MAKGLDYAWGRPDPRALATAGYTFACRYLGYDTSGKNLTADEVTKLHAAGLAVVLNFEYNPRGALNGYAQGIEDARISLQQANVLGAPESAVIYFSIDWNVQAAEMPMVLAYFDGVASILPLARIGVYGGIAVVRALLDATKVAMAWQTYAWSSGQWDSRAKIRQVANGVQFAGVDTDSDESETDQYGQWAPSTVDAPPPASGGDPLMGWETCSRATATREQTLTVQGLLLARGYEDIGSANRVPDGSWGDHTDASVRAFQVSHHVANSVTASGQGDGQVGPNTLRALAGL